MTKQEQISEFLRIKGATKCAPSVSFKDQAAPLGRARYAHEKLLTRGPERDLEVMGREEGAENRYLELQGVHS